MRSAVALVLVGLTGTAAAAADQLVPLTPAPPVYTPVLSIAGSLSPTFTDNALFSRRDRRDDVYFEPDVTVRLDGRFSPEWSWRLYVRGSFDAFARVREADEADFRLGARVTRNIFDWRVSLIYENRHVFEGIFENRLFTANDVKGSITRDFTFYNITVSPIVLLTYRFSDLPEAQRWRLDLVLPIEAKLNERWSLVSTPFVEGYWFTDGLNDGREDWIFSTSFGVKYNVTSNVSLTANAVYEQRWSNVPLRHYRDFTIGPKLDFVF